MAERDQQLDAATRAELDAIDRIVAGRPHADEDIALVALTQLLAEVRPQPEPKFVTDLDVRAEQWFGQRAEVSTSVQREAVARPAATTETWRARWRARRRELRLQTVFGGALAAVAAGLTLAFVVGTLDTNHVDQALSAVATTIVPPDGEASGLNAAGNNTSGNNTSTAKHSASANSSGSAESSGAAMASPGVSAGSRGPSPAKPPTAALTTTPAKLAPVLRQVVQVVHNHGGRVLSKNKSVHPAGERIEIEIAANRIAALGAALSRIANVTSIQWTGALKSTHGSQLTTVLIVVRSH